MQYLDFNRTPGKVLVVGSRIYEGRDDWRLAHPEGLGLDMLSGPGVDIVHNLENETPEAFIGAFSHIECISVLEHSQRPWIVAKNIEEMMQVGGSIYLSVPFIWRFHGYPHDYWRFTHASVPILFPGIEWQQVKYKSKKGVHDEPPAKYVGGPTKEHYLPQREVIAWGIKC